MLQGQLRCTASPPFQAGGDTRTDALEEATRGGRGGPGSSDGGDDVKCKPCGEGMKSNRKRTLCYDPNDKFDQLFKTLDQQKEKQCVLGSPTQQDVNHSEQDIIATIQDQKQKQDIGLVVIGKFLHPH